MRVGDGGWGGVGWAEAEAEAEVEVDGVEVEVEHVEVEVRGQGKGIGEKENCSKRFLTSKKVLRDPWVVLSSSPSVGWCFCSLPTLGVTVLFHFLPFYLLPFYFLPFTCFDSLAFLAFMAFVAFWVFLGPFFWGAFCFFFGVFGLDILTL